MAARDVTLADLTRDPAEVAGGLPEWQRGDRDEAIAKTLAAAARETHSRHPVLWVWSARNAGGDLVWVIPVSRGQTEAFAPRGPVSVLLGALAAAIDTGAIPEGVRALDWAGWTAMELPGADGELEALALAERNPAARVAVASMPEGLLGAPPEIGLAPLGHGGAGLVGLGHAVHAHPLEVALTLAEHGQSLDPVAAYPPQMADNLRSWGLSGAPAEELPVPDGPPGIADDPCWRRRHARRVLQRLLRMGKVGAHYHTAVDHLYRGAPADQRREALDVGEAMIRAGLLGEKPSVGQRHVYLRREALPEIHALIDRGETSSPLLEELWSCPPPG